VFVDADVIFAGSASPSEHDASLLVLRTGEITLIDAVTSRQAISEAERNLAAKMPAALSTFRLMVQRCLRVVTDPSQQDGAKYAGIAHPKDLPILVAAVRECCEWLLTFNVTSYVKREGVTTMIPLASWTTLAPARARVV